MVAAFGQKWFVFFTFLVLFTSMEEASLSSSCKQKAIKSLKETIAALEKCCDGTSCQGNIAKKSSRNIDSLLVHYVIALCNVVINVNNKFYVVIV